MTATPVAGLMPIPPGVAPNRTGVTSIQLQFIAASAVVVPLAAFAIAMRLYTRRCIVRSLGLDDYVAVLSFLVTIGFLVVCVEAMKVGFGRHLWDVPATAIPTYLKLWIPLGITYLWSPSLVKLSTLLLFHRLDSAKYFQYFHYTIYAVGLIVAGHSIAGTFVIGVGCTPTKSENQSCAFNYGTALAVLNILTDLLMLAIPVPLLWKLHIPLFQKWVVGLIFSIGSLVVIVSVIRLYYNFDFLDQPDFTWYIAKSATLSVIELNCAIICNCLVVLKPLVNKVFPKLLIYHSGGSASSDQHRPPIIRTNRLFSKFSADQSIELASVEGGSTSASHIMVTKSYGVQGRTEDSESMENIIQSRATSSHNP